MGSIPKWNPINVPTGKILHKHVQCDVCSMNPILGIRYKCKTCDDYDLCLNCYANKQHNHHKFLKMTEDISNLDFKTVHKHVSCDGCRQDPLTGARFRCLECENFDYCSNCLVNTNHSHNFEVILTPIKYD